MRDSQKVFLKCPSNTGNNTVDALSGFMQVMQPPQELHKLVG